jgi:hypothetical protein
LKCIYFSAMFGFVIYNIFFKFKKFDGARTKLRIVRQKWIERNGLLWKRCLMWRLHGR